MAITDWWPRSVYGVPVVREVFIETGCGTGNTLWEAKDLFPRCISIEIHAPAHAMCVDRFRDVPNVQIHLGDSATVLPSIIDPLRSTTFYLDAHCAIGTIPEAHAECPLLEELRIITATPWIAKPLIIVDDINMFLDDYWKDPNSNHHLFRNSDWPSIHEIQAILLGYRYLEDMENRVGIWA